MLDFVLEQENIWISENKVVLCCQCNSDAYSFPFGDFLGSLAVGSINPASWCLILGGLTGDRWLYQSGCGVEFSLFLFFLVLF